MELLLIVTVAVGFIALGLLGVAVVGELIALVGEIRWRP